MPSPLLLPALKKIGAAVGEKVAEVAAEGVVQKAAQQAGQKVAEGAATKAAQGVATKVGQGAAQQTPAAAQQSAQSKVLEAAVGGGSGSGGGNEVGQPQASDLAATGGPTEAFSLSKPQGGLISSPLKGAAQQVKPLSNPKARLATELGGIMPKPQAASMGPGIALGGAQPTPTPFGGRGPLSAIQQQPVAAVQPRAAPQVAPQVSTPPAAFAGQFPKPSQDPPTAGDPPAGRSRFQQLLEGNPFGRTANAFREGGVSEGALQGFNEFLNLAASTPPQPIPQAELGPSDTEADVAAARERIRRLTGL